MRFRYGAIVRVHLALRCVKIFYSKRVKDVETFRVKTSPLSELTLVLVGLHHVASFIVNTDHSIM